MPCAKKTLDILRLIVTNKKHSTAAALIDEIRNTGYRMQTARPVELAIGNMVRRVLHIIREEAKSEELEEAKLIVPQPASAEARPGQAGLLSQALKTGAGGHGQRSMLHAANRSHSLVNLLDVGIDLGALGVGLGTITETSANSGAVDQQLERLAAGLGTGQGAGAGGPGADAEAESQAGASTVAGGRRQQQAKQKAQVKPNWKGKQEVIDAVNELIDELDHIQGSITTQGVEHIHANEVILTMGMSDTTFLFLKEASKKREFQVVVAEAAPRFDGHVMARKLADAGIATTLIADSAVYAMMARANKVLVGAHAVLANGGVVCPVGMHMVALAAKRHSIPFVVLVGLHKLSPLFPTDPDLLYNEFKSPAEVIDFDVLGEAFVQQQQRHVQQLASSSGKDGGPAAGPSSGPGAATSSSSSAQPASMSIDCSPPPVTVPTVHAGAASAGGAGLGGPQQPPPQQLLHAAVAGIGGRPRWDPVPGNVHVPTPLFDYVPPHLISLFITDMGGRTPSYVYRLLTEYYSREDYFLSKEVFGR